MPIVDRAHDRSLGRQRTHRDPPMLNLGKHRLVHVYCKQSGRSRKLPCGWSRAGLVPLIDTVWAVCEVVPFAWSLIVRKIIILVN